MNITVLDGYALNPGDNPWEEVAKLGVFACFDRTPEELIVERAGDADIVLTNKAPLSARTIAQLPKLKFIGVTATGYNMVCLLYTSPSPRDPKTSRMPSSA